MKTIIYMLFILLLLSSCSSNSEIEVVDLPNYDTLKLVEGEEIFDSTKQTNSVFEGYKYANFKLKYFHSEGYSSIDRISYAITIIDSLLILEFYSPLNDEWNEINYKKQLVIEKGKTQKIKEAIGKSNINQKKEGFPERYGTGYGSDNIYIESDSLNVAGGVMWSCIGTDNVIEFEKRIQKEKEESTTIGGDYELLFKELEKLFEILPFLLEDKNNGYY